VTRRDRTSHAVARVKTWVDIHEAAAIVYDSYGRPIDELEEQRAAEAREDQRRDDDYREENDE